MSALWKVSGFPVYLQRNLLLISCDSVWVSQHYDTDVFLCNVRLDEMNVKCPPENLECEPKPLVRVVATFAK